MEPLVSISCLAFNHAPYIRQCLDGFIMQETDFPFEVLIHDDASTDETASIIKEYEVLYPEILKPIYEIENQWVKGRKGSSVFNFPRAKGKYIALCEGDDYWVDPRKLQKQVDYLEANPDYGMVYTNYSKFIQSKGKLIDSNFGKQGTNTDITPSLESFICKPGYFAPCTWLFRAELVHDINLQASIDHTFVLFANFLSLTKVHFLNTNTSVYRVNDESASHSRNYEKVYLRSKLLLKTQMELVEQFSLPIDIKRNIEINHYEKHLLGFIVNERWKDIEEARNVLRNRKLPILKNGAIVISRSRVGRYLLKILYNLYTMLK